MWRLYSLRDASWWQWWDWLLFYWRKPVIDHFAPLSHRNPDLPPWPSPLCTLAGPDGVIFGEQPFNASSASHTVNSHFSEVCRPSIGEGVASWIAPEMSGGK